MYAAVVSKVYRAGPHFYFLRECSVKDMRATCGRPARFQTSNFTGPYNLHRLLLSGLGLLFRSLPIVLLDQS